MPDSVGGGHFFLLIADFLNLGVDANAVNPYIQPMANGINRPPNPEKRT
jgi:hypothetical protein